MNADLLMFYNVENLYPPQKETISFPKTGLYNWDDYKYQQKIRKITNVFNFIKEDYLQLPSIIGLAEIGDRLVLEDLTKEESPLQNYEIVYQKSQDSRGLNVALLYDKTKWTLTNYTFIKFPTDDDIAYNTRDLLHAEMLYQEKKINIIITHLPSKRQNDAKKQLRDHIIDGLQQIIQSILRRDEVLLIMGDFNENPNSPSIKQLLCDENNNKQLDNPFTILFENQQFSNYHGKRGALFDQIIFSEKTLKNHWPISQTEASIYQNEKLRNRNAKHNKYPIRTYSGSRYIGGYSDHFPVLLKWF